MAIYPEIASFYHAEYIFVVVVVVAIVRPDNNQ